MDENKEIESDSICEECDEDIGSNPNCNNCEHFAYYS